MQDDRRVLELREQVVGCENPVITEDLRQAECKFPLAGKLEAGIEVVDLDLSPLQFALTAATNLRQTGRP